MKKENNIILCGIAIAVLASAGFAMSQGTISSADDNYVTPVSYTHLDVYKRQV